MRRTPQPAKAYVAARGIPQKQLAEAVGVTEHWLGRVLNGRADGSTVLRHRIADRLGIPVGELFDDVDGGDDEAVAALLRRTRVDRGMALVVDDPIVIAKLASLLASEQT